ncbi:hypothetical protein [Larkinella punicea]|uniref:Uncharacterized protein n=1 Tax=Larkinella punicea TaxID=2315727 RepID=A0A368JKY5_9BACT|nr:hypothetical protein [Larkinella punicea]RCR68330.1 hypothetical protein DUE52_16340 [Larkinella punicea]
MAQFASAHTAQYHRYSHFVKEEMAKRLNGPYNVILEAWIQILFGDEVSQEKSFYSFGELSGIDASFTISKVTSFSHYL